MLINKYLQFSSNLFVENKLLKFVIVVLALLLVFSFYQTRTLIADQKVILVPVGLSDKVMIGQTSVDEVYLQSMGAYIATLMYSTTPLKVQGQYRMLTSMMTPSAYNTYGNNLINTSLSHVKNEVTQTMTFEGITMQTEPKRLIIVTAFVDKFIFGNLAEKLTVNLTIGYEVQNGKIYITSLDDKKVGER